MKASLIKGYSLKFLRVRQSKVPTSLKIIFRDRMHLELLPIQTKMKTENQKPNNKNQNRKNFPFLDCKCSEESHTTQNNPF